ncbi:hypothetical protein H0H92_015453 [Tricholoma furcatifolium]|nr:hypothetical protein H0H92_015453 [Tricholoma furcatifolium]
MGSKPELVFSGINVAGNNIGCYLPYSGTIGAATEAALEGIPSVAFSSAGAGQYSYTTLANHTYQPTIDANIYSALSLKFLHQLLDNSGPILPANISLNVNFPSTKNCSSPDDFKFVFTRVAPSTDAQDFPTCGETTLPDEFTLLTTETGCYSSVSVFSATNKSDVNAEIQGLVHQKIAPLLTCLPKGYLTKTAECVL